MTEKKTVACSDCGNEFTIDFDKELEDPITCYGSDAQHPKQEIVRPCGRCGKPIRTAEICHECAEESDTDAVTPTWGKHRY